MRGVTEGKSSSGQRRGMPKTITVSEVLAEVDAGPVPGDLRVEIQALDRDWNQSRRAEEWVVNACLEAGRADVLAELINQHGAARLTGIRAGAGIVAHLLGNCTSLAHIEFSGTKIGDGEANSLVRALQECPSLKSLAFRNCWMSDDALSALAEGLPEMHHLETFCIEARSGKCLNKLGPGIAAHTTLTSLVLEILNLDADKALKFGQSLRDNRTLTMLEVHVSSSGALTSLLAGLASTEGSGIDEGSPRAVEQPGALPRLTRLDLCSHEMLDGAFCDALSECIETRKALTSLCIRPGVRADEASISRLRSAIEGSAVEIDFDASKLPQPLARLAKVRSYQQLILPAPVMIARQLLASLPDWARLPRELKAKIEGDLFGNGSPRELWPLQSLMRLSKEVRKAAAGIRSATHCERFAAPMGRCDLPYKPDLGAFMRFWHLQLSGIEVGESAALLLPEWQLTSEKSSGLSADQRVFRRKLEEVGVQLVGKQVEWVRRLIEDGNRDEAAFALPIAQRLIRKHSFHLENDAALLSRRLVLGEVRHHRRLAVAHLAKWMFMGTLVLAVAGHFFDVVMRKLFDQDSAYGIGAPMTLDESFAQRRAVASWVVWPLVAVLAFLMLKVEWVDAITRRLRLPQL